MGPVGRHLALLTFFRDDPRSLRTSFFTKSGKRQRKRLLFRPGTYGFAG